MHILITGAGGYLGTVLVRHLLAVTHDSLTLLDRFDYGVQPLLSVLRSEDLPRVRLLRGDVRHAPTVQDAAARADVIVHLAGIVGYPACDADPQDADSTNVAGTRVVCAQCVPVIFASTGSCYGQVEGEATEDSPLSPLTRYGRNKAEAEQLVLGYGGVVLRLATLFGPSPRMRWDLLPHDFCRRGVRGEIQLYEPEARRTFLHVEDAARGLEMALRLPSGVWNVGDPALNWTKRKLALHVQQITGCALSDGPGSDPDQRDYAVNYGKIRRAGFRTLHTLNTTLEQIVGIAKVWR